MQQHEATTEQTQRRRGRPYQADSLMSKLREIGIHVEVCLTPDDLTKRDGTKYAYSTVASTLFTIGKKLDRKYSLRRSKTDGGLYVTRLQ